MRSLLSLALLTAAFASPSIAQREAVPPADRFELKGLVRDVRESPIPGISLNVRVEQNGEVLARRSATTDRTGHYLVRFEVSEAPEGRFRVVAQIDEPGYQERRASKWFNSAPTNPEPLLARWSDGAPTGQQRMYDLTTARGATFRVRVDGGSDPPFGRAVIHFVGETASQRNNAMRRRGSEFGYTSEHGLYLLHLAEPWTGHLVARREEVGSGALGPISLDPEKPPAGELGPIELTGTRLSGRLVDSTGTPIVGRDLVAISASRVEDPDAARTARNNTAFDEIAGLGLTTSSTTTDERGRIEIRGMAPGEYFFVPTDGGYYPYRTSGAKPFDLPRTVVRTDVEFELEAHSQRLRVSVLDEHGSPIESGTPFVQQRRNDGWVEPRLDFDRLRSAPGVWEIPVAPAEEYLIVWREAGRQVASTKVRIDGDDPVIEASLRLAPEVESARLVVKAPALGTPPMDGEPGVAELMLRYDVEVTARLFPIGVDASIARATLDAEGGSAALWPQPEEVSARWLMEDVPEEQKLLPPGPYLLRVEPTFQPRFCGNNPLPEIWHGRFETEIQLEPGAERTVEADLFAGGRVELELALPEVPRDRRLVPTPPASRDTWTWRSSILQLEDDPTARVFEVLGDGSRRPLQFYFWTDTSTGTHGPRVVPGVSSFSFDVLRPGWRTIVVETPGFEPETLTLRIHRYETTRARVELRETP